METKELKNTIEAIYKIQMAAVNVMEANEEYLTAKKAQQSVSYDWTHKDLDNNNLWSSLTDKMYQKEGLLKKAVNNFFKAAGHPEKVQKWDLGFSAILEYNRFIEDSYLFNKSSNLIPTFSLYECRARKY